MNPKTPLSREMQEREDSGHAVQKSWYAACVEGRSAGGQHRIQLLAKQREKMNDPIVASDYGFLTQNADTLPILICRDSKNGQTGATCCERKRPTTYPISFFVRFVKVLGFRSIILKYDVFNSKKHRSESIHKDHLKVTKWPVVLKWL